MSPRIRSETPHTLATKIARRVLLAFAFAGLLLTGVIPAEAATRKDVSDARSRYKSIQSQLNDLAENYARQQDRLDGIRAKISTTERQIAETEKEAEALRGQLRTRVRTAYRMGGLGFFDFILSAESFRDFSLRVIMLERQASHDEDLLLRMNKLHGELEAKEHALQAQKKEQAAEVAALRDQARKLNTTFAEAKSVLSRLENQLRAQELASLFRSRRGSGGGSGRTVGLEACPAKGPHAFSNDWGAPRGGGRRSHRGNDIFAPMGSPAGAVVSGRISGLRSGGLGGLSVYLWGDDGNEYYYAHMSGFAASQGQRVSAGQTIAYVGNTGNARGGAPHIHFEIHPGGGSAINPFYSLIRVC